MKQTSPLAIVLILVSVLTYLTLPAKTDDINQKLRNLENNSTSPIFIDSFKKEIQTVPSSVKSINPLLDIGYQLLTSQLDFNGDGFNDIILIKKIFESVSSTAKPKKSPNDLFVYGLNIVNSRNESELLSINKDGIFQNGKAVIPIISPTYGYKILFQKINASSILALRIEIINKEFEIVSDQLAIYWDVSTSKVIATNEFAL